MQHWLGILSHLSIHLQLYPCYNNKYLLFTPGKTSKYTKVGDYILFPKAVCWEIQRRSGWENGRWNYLLVFPKTEAFFYPRRTSFQSFLWRWSACKKKQSRMFSFSEDAAHFHYTEVVHLLYSEGTRFDFTETVYLLFSKAARFPFTEVVVHILFPKTAQFHFTVVIHLFSEGSSLWFYRGRQSIFRGRPIFILRRQSNFFFPKRARFHFTAAVTFFWRRFTVILQRLSTFFLKAAHFLFTDTV